MFVRAAGVEANSVPKGNPYPFVILTDLTVYTNSKSKYYMVFTQMVAVFC